MTQTTYIGKASEVHLRANEGSRRVTIGVAGREAEMSVQEARRVYDKLKRAILTSS